VKIEGGEGREGRRKRVEEIQGRGVDKSWRRNKRRSKRWGKRKTKGD
jgi:hypothetical protein